MKHTKLVLTLLALTITLPVHAQAQIEIRRDNTVIMKIDQAEEPIFTTTFKTDCSCSKSLEGERVNSGAIYYASENAYIEMLRGHEAMGERPLVSQTLTFTFPNNDNEEKGDQYRAMELGAFGIIEQEGKPGLSIKSLECDGKDGRLSLSLDSLLLKKIPPPKTPGPYTLDENDTITIQGTLSGPLVQNEKMCDL